MYRVEDLSFKQHLYKVTDSCRPLPASPPPPPPPLSLSLPWQSRTRRKWRLTSSGLCLVLVKAARGSRGAVDFCQFYAHVLRVSVRAQVDINAQENRLTGTAITVEDGFSLVVVEGSSKGIKRYGKLMLRRIDWNPQRDDEDMEERPPNSCHLVWQVLSVLPFLSLRATRLSVPPSCPTIPPPPPPLYTQHTLLLSFLPGSRIVSFATMDNSGCSLASSLLAITQTPHDTCVRAHLPAAMTTRAASLRPLTPPPSRASLCFSPKAQRSAWFPRRVSAICSTLTVCSVPLCVSVWQTHLQVVVGANECLTVCSPGASPGPCLREVYKGGL